MGWVRWLRLFCILTLIVVIYFVVPVSARAQAGMFFRGALTLLLFCALVFGMVRQLRAHVDDTARHLDGLVASIVVAVVVFSFAFYVLELRSPGQVAGLDTRLDALYFTASTLITVGYGDVHAVGQAARALVLAQMIFNVVFVAAAAALLSTRVREGLQVRAQSRTTQRNPK